MCLKTSYLISCSACSSWASQVKQIRAFKTPGCQSSVPAAHRGLSELPAMPLPCVNLREDNVAALGRHKFQHNFLRVQSCKTSLTLYLLFQRGSEEEILANLMCPQTGIDYQHQVFFLFYEQYKYTETAMRTRQTEYVERISVSDILIL